MRLRPRLQRCSCDRSAPATKARWKVSSIATVDSALDCDRLRAAIDRLRQSTNGVSGKPGTIHRRAPPKRVMTQERNSRMALFPLANPKVRSREWTENDCEGDREPEVHSIHVPKPTVARQ